MVHRQEGRETAGNKRKGKMEGARAVRDCRHSQEIGHVVAAHLDYFKSIMKFHYKTMDTHASGLVVQRREVKAHLQAWLSQATGK